MNSPEYPDGTPSWIELLTTDPDGAADFYGELFGWEQDATDDEFGGYRTFLLDGQMIAGCMLNPEPESIPNVWFVYLKSANAVATVEAARAAGSHVGLEPMTVGDMGSMAVVSDPGGAMVGVWESGTHHGMGVIEEPNTPGWFELHTKDYEPTVEFYRNVFGWDAHTLSDDPSFRYTTYGEGDSQRAGIMDATAFLPDEVPSHWSVYFTVANADSTMAKAIELGATELLPLEDTPYGRIGSLMDPSGVQLKLRQLTS